MSNGVEGVRNEIAAGVETLGQAPIGDTVQALRDVGLQDAVTAQIQEISGFVDGMPDRINEVYALAKLIVESASEGQGAFLAAMIGSGQPEATGAINSTSEMHTQADTAITGLANMVKSTNDILGTLGALRRHIASYEQARAEVHAHLVGAAGARNSAVSDAKRYINRLQ
ncbi:MAG TPA: hypothetical protein VLH86_00615 [Patescibacteria group bacterium]|nr:hypothetical protein [Patescibacteria group bacterium]